uniref:lysylphosphatidylglycerol synthase domain-containing protein n=1 Tax=Streptomyces sp. SID7805 TaxID=2690328 RepID=UPI00069C424D
MNRRVWAVARVLIGLGILVVVLWRMGTGASLAALRSLDAATPAIALGIGLFTTVLSALRWRLVAGRLGLRLPLGAAVADYYRALFLNAALPGGVLGDVHRAVRHGKDSGDLGRGVRAVVLERTAGQVALIAVVAIALPADPALFRHGRGAPLGLLLLVAAAVLGAAVIALVAAARWGRYAARLRRALSAARTDLRLGLLARDTWPAVAGLSLAVLAGHLGMFLVAARVTGTRAPVGQLVPLFLLALLAMALPVNIGGWGPREGVLALAFSSAGLSAEHGLAVSVVYGVLAFVSSLPGAGVLLLRQARPRPAGTELELQECVLPECEAAHRGP